MLKNIFSSARLLKNTRVLCTCAIFVALYVVLDIAQIPITQQMRISFTFLTTALAGWLFGPIPAAIVGILGDTVGFIVHPTGAYFPGFGITAMLMGAAYGLCLFGAEKKYLLPRIIIVQTAVTLLFNLLLNTYWLSVLFEKGYLVYFYSRAVKVFATLPMNIAVLYVIMLLLMKHGIKRIYK